MKALAGTLKIRQERLLRHYERKTVPKRNMELYVKKHWGGWNSNVAGSRFRPCSKPGFEQGTNFVFLSQFGKSLFIFASLILEYIYDPARTYFIRNS